MSDSNYSRTLRYAQRSRDRRVGDLRREGLHVLALRVERIAAVLQVLEECTPEPEPPKVSPARH